MSHCADVAPAGQAESKPEPYGKMPHSFHADRNLSDADYRVLGSLLYWAKDKHECWPSTETIAQRIGKKRRAIQVSLKHLEHLGYIRIEPEPANENNKTGRKIILVWREGDGTIQAVDYRDSPRKVYREKQASRRDREAEAHTCAPKGEAVYSAPHVPFEGHHPCVPSPQLEVTLLTREAQAADDVDWKPPTGGTPDRQRERLIVHMATLAALDRRQRRAAVNAAATLFVDLLMDDGSLDFHRRVCWAVAKGQLSGSLVADAFRETYDQIAERGVGVLGAYYVGCLRNMIGDGALADMMTALADDPEGAAEEYGCVPLTLYRENVA